jgi:hypothetical protein
VPPELELALPELLELALLELLLALEALLELLVTPAPPPPAAAPPVPGISPPTPQPANGSASTSPKAGRAR